MFSQGLLHKILYISEIILRDRHFFRNSVGKQEISDGNKISLGNSEGKKISEIILKFKKKSDF